MDGYLGKTKLFAGGYAPKNWTLCAGQYIIITDYPALYSILDTSFGGDGMVNFQLPDLRGRIAIGAGKGTGLNDKQEGWKGGVESRHLHIDEMPSHRHAATVSAPSYSGVEAQKCFKGFGTGNTDPENRYMDPAPAGSTIYYDNAGGDMAPPDVNIIKTGSYSVDVQYNGSGIDFTLMSPFLALNYIICVVGLYPPRT